MIKNRQVYGGPKPEIPQDLSFGKHVIDKLRELGDRVALINAKTEKQTSCSELLGKIVRIATGLKQMGIGTGYVVAVCSENCSEHLAATMAAVAVGATVTLLIVKYTQDEMVNALNIAKPKLVFCSEATLKTNLSILRKVSCVEHIVQLAGGVSDEGVQPLAALEVLDCRLEEFEPEAVCQAQDTAFIFYSSGTTGLPKGVMLTHQNILHGTSIYNYANKSKEKVLTVIPWYHVFGLLTTFKYLITGNLVVYLAEFGHEIFLSTIEKYQISEIVVVPPIVHVLAKSPSVVKYDLSSIRKIRCGGAPLSADIINSAQNNLPKCEGIFQCYGMTETTLAIILEPYNCKHTRKPGSCGVPFPGVIVKVVDVETRDKLGSNEEGEVCIKSPTLMKGYVDNEEATRLMFDEDGFIKTGDIGYYENDGYFHIIDRLKELIKYKGNQARCLITAHLMLSEGVVEDGKAHLAWSIVAPAMVEGVIMAHESVAECGVVGAPDEVAGELPTAFVVLKPGAELTEQDLLHFTSARLSSTSRLRGGVIFLDEIPKNGSGKILRRELRNILRLRVK